MERRRRTLEDGSKHSRTGQPCSNGEGAKEVGCLISSQEDGKGKGSKTQKNKTKKKTKRKKKGKKRREKKEAS